MKDSTTLAHTRLFKTDFFEPVKMIFVYEFPPENYDDLWFSLVLFIRFFCHIFLRKVLQCSDLLLFFTSFALFWYSSLCSCFFFCCGDYIDLWLHAKFKKSIHCSLGGSNWEKIVKLSISECQFSPILFVYSFYRKKKASIVTRHKLFRTSLHNTRKMHKYSIIWKL